MIRRDNETDKDTNKSCRPAGYGHPPVQNWKGALSGIKDGIPGIAGNPWLSGRAILCTESGIESIPVTHSAYYHLIPFFKSIYN